MELTQFDLDGIRQDNLRGVSVEEFAAVWRAAEARGSELVADGSPSEAVHRAWQLRLPTHQSVTTNTAESVTDISVQNCHRCPAA